ncbi:MAG: hypothetical protein OES20_16170 [Gammaproteobacteria bacterium]|nr:hypothetical protein [Gammaproteobacteria bacterium]MDH3858290.1 hypothetical protein [Gammaproteobacteria bacterium]
MKPLLILLLVYSGVLYAAEPEIETVSDTEFAFNIDGSHISVEIRDRVLRGKKDMLLEWVLYSSKTVHQYYGRFPVTNVHIDLQVTDGHTVRFGQAFGGDSPSMRIVVGENITPAMLRKDWILVHEMVHLAMADVPYAHRWWLEGLATYVESIARAQQGHLSEEFVWNGFINRMPQGLPKNGDRGLDRTPTWGRTYWGGAIFCMLADIEIRKLSDNRLSLRDALRGILDAGLSMHASSSAMEVFESADRAIGLDVLVPLYLKTKADPYPVDLDALWTSLGVSLQNDQVVYNDDAPMAHVRKKLLKS